MTRVPIPHPKATKEQRRNVITGTDMKRLVNGEWHKLWTEKTGRALPVDLTYIWKPRLGLATEGIHAWWHGFETGDDLLPTPDQPCYFADVELPAHYACTFDRWIPGDNCPLELKHTNERNSLREAAEYYMPQLQWQIMVSGAERVRFSIICGNSEPVWGYVSRDEDLIKRYRRMADAFWDMLQADLPPPPDQEPDVEAVKAAKQVPINGMKAYDFASNNEWCVKAARYVELKPKAEEYKEAEQELRALIPADASELTGAGLKVKRDKRGACRITVQEGADA